jgi:ATP-dependent RNA helicase DOB1
VFPAGGEGLYLVVDDKNKFREDNFQKAMSVLQAPPEIEEKNSGRKTKRKSTNSLQTDLVKIIRLVP